LPQLAGAAVFASVVVVSDLWFDHCAVIVRSKSSVNSIQERRNELLSRDGSKSERQAYRQNAKARLAFEK
jgi:hypothetical protein